jgi:hypothetical protein
MREYVAIGLLATAITLAGCGKSEPEKEEPPMRVEDTAFGPLVGTPKKVQNETDAAARKYRDKLNERLDADEGGNKKDEPPQD